jgi:hypothetical protein
MARANGPAERVAITLLLGLLASALAAILLAPVVTVGWCSDAPEGGASVCGSEQRSLLGAAAPWWLWLAVQAAVIVITIAIARRRFRQGSAS